LNQTKTKPFLVICFLAKLHGKNRLYSDLFVEGTNLLKVEKEELQEYIYDNYRDFIALQGEYDEFYKQFGDIKS